MNKKAEGTIVALVVAGIILGAIILSDDIISAVKANTMKIYSPDGKVQFSIADENNTHVGINLDTSNQTMYPDEFYVNGTGNVSEQLYVNNSPVCTSATGCSAGSPAWSSITGFPSPCTTLGNDYSVSIINSTLTCVRIIRQDNPTTCTSGNYSYWNGSKFLCSPDTGGSGTGDNASWNETYANTLFYPRTTNPSGFYNSTTIPAYALLTELDNSTIIRQNNGSWVSAAVGNYSAASAGLYTNISGLQAQNTTNYNTFGNQSANFTCSAGNAVQSAAFNKDGTQNTTGCVAIPTVPSYGYSNITFINVTNGSVITNNTVGFALNITPGAYIQVNLTSNTYTIGLNQTIPTQTTYTANRGINLTGTTFGMNSSGYVGYNSSCSFIIYNSTGGAGFAVC